MQVKQLEARRNALVRLLLVPMYNDAECQAYIKAAIARVESVLRNTVYNIYTCLRLINPEYAGLIDDWYNTDGINPYYKVHGLEVLTQKSLYVSTNELEIVLNRFWF